MSSRPQPLPESLFEPRPLPIRWRDRVLVPPAPRDTALITGFPARTPERLLVEIPDPVSGRATPMAVWHHRAEEPRGGVTGGTAGGAAPVVAIHGFRGDHHGLALVVDCLPEQDLYLPELPGFGDSPAFPDAEHTVAHYAAAVAAAVEALALVPTTSPGRRAAAPTPEGPRPTLLGHSFGTVVAAHLAADAPGRWDRLVLLNPICEPALTADDSTAKVLMSRIASGYYEVAAALPDRLGHAVLSSPLVVWITGTVMAKTSDRNTLAYLHDQHQNYFSAFDHRSMLVESYRASTTGSVLDVAEQLSLPVLLVVGAEDELGSVRGQRKLARRIGRASPGVELEVLDGVGHLIHYERAPEAAGLIRSFIARTGVAPSD